MKFSTTRGTKDILPDEIGYWQHIERVSREVFGFYNYQEIRTPVFEETGLFLRSIGDATDIVEKEMYSFIDKGDRSLTLRPECTAPIARAYLQNNFHNTQPKSKLFYSGPMFRYERPQAGRYRQFHQMGVENLGSDHPFSDAEVITLGVHLFDEIGLSGLSVNINSVGCPVCRPVIEERLKQFIGNSLPFLCGDCQRRYQNNPLRLLDCKNEKCATYLAGLPDIRSSHCQECKDHFSAVLEYIDSLGIPYHINPRLVRGLDYYTRTTFEIVSDVLGAQNAICGGGRYDYLVEQLGGPHTPAVGFAFGMERAVMILKEISETAHHESVTAFVAPIGFAQQAPCFYLMDELRRAGIRSEMDYTKTDLKTLLKQANKLNAKFTLIYGEEEAEHQQILLKDMHDGSQRTVPIKKVVKEIVKLSKEKSH